MVSKLIFKNFTCFPVKIVGIGVIFEVKSRNAVNLAMKHANFCFTTLHSAVFGKVRELVGEFKYAFVVRSNKVVGIN